MAKDSIQLQVQLSLSGITWNISSDRQNLHACVLSLLSSAIHLFFLLRLVYDQGVLSDSTIS
nr:hypothetical protein Q903MT_gene3468 [Picea sitchensis]